MRTSVVLIVLTMGLWPTGQAISLEIDLRSAAADLTLWGAAASARTASAVGFGDLNGDGVVDMVFTDNTAAGSRYCIVFGPVRMPAETDLASSPPDSCILIPRTSSGGLSTQGYVRLGDLDGDGIDDIV